MARLTKAERERIIKLIRDGKPLPQPYRSLLFPNDDVDYVEATKDYRLIYKGKMSKEEVLRTTPAAPLQHIRSFNADNPFEDDWRNMLIFGDNLLALKALYSDQQGPDKYRTRNRIKLIYIDPPFATRQDFMKDREKAYRDKVIGSQFIEFLRRRLILMREILAQDGSIFVHLDSKKGHYIKAVLDEVFGEENFINEVVWQRSSAHNDAQRFGVIHDTLFVYGRSNDRIFHPVYTEYDLAYIAERFRSVEEGTSRRYWLNTMTGAGSGPPKVFAGKPLHPPPGTHWRLGQKKIDEYIASGKIVFTDSGKPYIKQYLDEGKGRPVQSIWTDIVPSKSGRELTGYPTQKPEKLLARIIDAATNEDDIVLDSFCGSGSTAAVAQKRGRRWIAMDCGRLATYLSQKRLLNLSTHIGSPQKDGSREHERVPDFDAHSKSPSRGLLMVYDKARQGDLNITDGLLKALAKFLEENISGVRGEEFSLVCPEAKFKVEHLKIIEEDLKAGEKAIDVGRIRFLISFVQPKAKTPKPKPLKAKEFALYHAGIYDKDLILNMPWEQYRPFVLQLFGVREEAHKICGVEADGYIGLHSALLWDYPNHTELRLDRGFIESLHQTMRGRGGERFYIVAPGAVMEFMEDEVRIGKTTYVILKVPLSVLMALIERAEVGSLRQPTSEADVNEVIDAVGYDFISQPCVLATFTREKPQNPDLWAQKNWDFVIRLQDFRSNTLTSDPEDFRPFETFSMVLADVNYDGDAFNLSHVFWADDILAEEQKHAVIRIPQDEVSGNELMVIFMDKYGNELKVRKSTSDFKRRRKVTRGAKKKQKK